MNLRRWITALAILAVFTAVAGAQVTSNQVSCTASPASTPNIRAEGLTERAGDVLITCINGLQLSSGNVADRINISVTYNAPITNPVDATGKISDILLTIDEPNSLPTAAANELGIQGYGPNAAIGGAPGGICTVANQAANAPNCAAFSYLVGNPAVYYVTSFTGQAGGGNAVNVYQGAVNAAATTVTFSYVPFVPPYVNTAGQGTLVSRVFRITGVRVNPNGQSAITATVAQPVTNAADISTFNTLASPNVPVASVVTSLTTSVVPNALTVCVQTALTPVANQPQIPASASYLKFGQNFNGAFKTRVVAIDNVAADNATLTGPALQLTSAPVNGKYPLSGGAFSNANSESGILIPIPGAVPTAVAGLATSGTRLKAVFANLDTTGSTKYYVSLNNIADFNDPVAANKTPATAGDSTAAPFAVLQTQANGETSADGVTNMYASSTDTAGNVAIGARAVPVIQLNVVSGKAEAVWEITNTAGAADASTYTFAVYAVFAANQLNPAPATAATVVLGYAPTNGTAATSPVGVTTTWIPRYVAPPAAPQPLLSLLPCRTTLLFPFLSSMLVSANSSWATGIAIENTGSDPLTTVGGTGTCTLNFYGAGAPPTITVGPIAPGTGYTFLSSDPGNTGVANSNWTGYAFAVCNFNYAHGFVFIEDNTRSMAMGYLAEVLNQQTASVPRDRKSVV